MASFTLAQIEDDKKSRPRYIDIHRLQLGSVALGALASLLLASTTLAGDC